MKIRIEFEKKEEADVIISDLKKNYNVTYISKIYNNRPPSKMKRVYTTISIPTHKS